MRDLICDVINYCARISDMFKVMVIENPEKKMEINEIFTCISIKKC